MHSVSHRTPVAAVGLELRPLFREHLCMSDAGAQRIETILEALACPQCQYSLRGLAGEVITCPECGHGVNVNAYVAAQWRAPWFRAPLYNTLAFPLAWATIVGLGTLILATFSGIDLAPVILLGGLMLLTLGWIGMLSVVVRRFGSQEGLWLALLVHCTLPGYLGGLLLFVGGIVALLSNVGRMMWWHMLYCSGLALAGILAVVGAFLIERFVAHRCIRRHLRLAADRAV